MSSSWLDAFLDAYLSAFDPVAIATRVKRVRKPWTQGVTSAGKRWIYWSLHQRGVAYGLPLARPDLLQEINSGEWDSAFAPFLAIWCDLILEVETLAVGTVRTTHQREWLLCCLAAFVNEESLARQLFAVTRGEQPAKRLLAKALRVLEAELKTRRYVASNPLLGLPLRNGFVFSDARLVGRIALKIAAQGQIDTAALERLRAYSQHERRLLVASLCALVSAREEISGKARRIAAGQLAGTGLPRAQIKTLKRLLDKPPSVAQIIELVDRPKMAGYLMEQVVLAAIIDGRIDSQERAFVDQLGEHLAMPRQRVRRIEWRVRRFFEFHRDLFDLFTETQYYGELETVFSQRVVKLVARNLDAVVTEIRQTGELASLLTKAAGGQKLDADERARVREQLLDILKAIPSLAIFTIPGGALLLPIVLKLLPWDLRPSAFRDASKKQRER